MRRHLPNLAVAAVMTAVVALASGPGWAVWVVGAAYAAVLAIGVWIGSAATADAWSLQPAAYATAAAVALVVGGATWWATGADNGAFWGVGVVMGIAVSTGARPARAR